VLIVAEQALVDPAVVLLDRPNIVLVDCTGTPIVSRTVFFSLSLSLALGIATLEQTILHRGCSYGRRPSPLALAKHRRHGGRGMR